MDIKIVSAVPNEERGKVSVNLLIDGKKKWWNMSAGLWEFVQKLIMLAQRTRKEP